jgi:hypothetical protein
MAQSQQSTAQHLRGPGLAASVAAAIAFLIPGGQPAAVVFFTTFATTYALQAFAMREARKASLQDVSERKSNIRSATSPHRIVYGQALVGGTVANAQVTGSDKEYIHLILTLAGHEVHSIADVWVEDVRTTRDGSGNVTAGGDLPGLARFIPALGTNPQTADATFVTESAGKWTADHKGNGIAYLYARLRFDQDKLYILPVLRALVRGRMCYDPRDAATRFTMNPALCLRDYLIADFGMDIDPAEIDDTSVAAAANICDEWVALDAAVTLTPTPDHTTDTWTTPGVTDPRIGTGDRFILTGVPVPSGLTSGATYYVIRLDGSTYQLASTYQNAIEGIPVTFTNNGSGTQTWGTFHQRRYTCNGSFTADQAPKDIVEDLLSAMAGNLVQVAGQIFIHAGAYTAPTITLTADDIRDAVSIRPRKPRHELVNQIRGSYVDASRVWVQSEYPPVGSATYIAQDDGITIERNVDQALATDASRAQRIAKIALQRSRAGTLSLRCKIGALRLRGFDTVAVTIPQLGLSAATYRIMRLDITGDDGGLGVDLALQAESAATYAWSPSDATAPVPVPVLDIPTFGAVVVAPSSLSLASGNAELLSAADGTIISRLRVTWGSAPEPGLTGYEVQYKRAAESVYISVSAARDSNQTWISPVEDGTTYDVRVRALAGTRRSAWVTASQLVAGKTANPTAPTSLAVVAAPQGFDIAWSACPDADYATSQLYEATSNNRGTATLLADMTGNRFSRAGLPASVSRWYWVRHVDRSGNVSDWFPSSATAGVTAVTLAASGGGVPTVTDASVITATPGNPPPGGADFWAVFSNHDGKIWRWNQAAGSYTKAADGGDLTAGTVAADKIAVANLAAINANLGAITAGSIDIGSGKFTVSTVGAVEIRSATTGERTEIANEGVKVYDAGGVLRVELGELAP